MRLSLRKLALTVIAVCATIALPHWNVVRAGDEVAASASPMDSAAGALRDGLALENDHLWVDAIQHYENALRKWEGDAQLRQRLLICRLHHDVCRRYADHSFTESIRRIPTQQALDLYAEVLANLETHYVETPRWSDVLRYGTASLEVALTESAFLESQLKGVPADRIEHFRQTVHQHVIQRPSSTRYDLRASAAHVASLARQELGLSGTAAVMEFVCGAISTLDPYSRFLTSNQLDETFSNIDGNFVGLGVELKAEENCLRIVNVIAKGPAERAGIEAGDAIISVEGTSAESENPDVVADLLRGPENSVVRVGLLKRDGRQIELTVPRQRVEVPSVEQVRMVEPDLGIGYFRLTSFQKNTPREVDEALWALQRQGMRYLVLDLRGNPGGLLSAAVEVADRFLRDGRIVTTRGRNAAENLEYFAYEQNTLNVPLIVLIDGDSASASEIFAGAISDRKRGHLIGERTYGKGSVQGIFRMHSARVGLCLTTAKYYTPNNIAVSNRGVAPDEEVAATYITARPTEDGHLATITEDSVLSAAVAYVRNARVSRLP